MIQVLEKRVVVQVSCVKVYRLWSLVTTLSSFHTETTARPRQHLRNGQDIEILDHQEGGKSNAERDGAGLVEPSANTASLFGIAGRKA